MAKQQHTRRSTRAHHSHIEKQKARIRQRRRARKQVARDPGGILPIALLAQTPPEVEG